MLEDSVQEFNRGLLETSKKSTVKANSANLTHQELLKVYEEGGSVLIEFARAYNGRDSNDLITNPDFNKAVDKYLLDVGAPKVYRGMMKSQLMSLLSEE